MTQLLPRLFTAKSGREATRFLDSTERHFAPNLPRIESGSDSIRLLFCRFVFEKNECLPLCQLIKIESPRRLNDAILFSQTRVNKLHRCPVQFVGLWAERMLHTQADFELLPDSISLQPSAAAIVSGHRPSHTKRASRHHGGAARVKLGTKYYFEQRKKLSRFPTQFRCDQARQQMSAGTARRVSKCLRALPAPYKARKPPPWRRSARQIGNKVLPRTKKEIESLPDSISLRPSAAAGVSGHCPLRGR